MSRLIPSVNGAAIQLRLAVEDPIVVSHFKQFKEEEWPDKALNVLRFGILAMQAVGPALDAEAIQEKFGCFLESLQENMEGYFKEKNGVLPRSLAEFFGDKGVLTRTFHSYFEPREGRLAQLIQAQVGPASHFGRIVDPKNKEGLIALVDKAVHDQLEAKMAELLSELSLDNDDSAMSHLRGMIGTALGEFKKAIGVQEGKKEEAERGHVKGFDFQKDLYEQVAALGRELGDETEYVADSPGSVPRCKSGDHLVALGDTTAAPGVKIVVEAKDKAMKRKEAVEELQRARENRQAEYGIFVFSKGCEPEEFGDFQKVGDDLFCTAAKDDLASGQRLVYVEAAYKIARALAVAKARKEVGGEIDAERLQKEIDGLLASLEQMSEVITKARTVKNSGEAIEKLAGKLQQEWQERLDRMLELVRSDNEA